MITSPQRRNWTSACPQAPGFEVLSEHQPESLWQSEHFWQPSAQRAARGFFRPQRGENTYEVASTSPLCPGGQVGWGGKTSIPPRSQRAGGWLQRSFFISLAVCARSLQWFSQCFFARFLEHFYKVFRKAVTTFLQGVLQCVLHGFLHCVYKVFRKVFRTCLQGVLQGF